MVSAAWLASIAALTLAILAVALLLPGRPWSTRTVPADVFRVWTGVAFAAWVHPSLGLLAGVAAWWWVPYGYLRVAGGTLWPLVAMAVVLGSAASPSAVTAAIAILLACGVIQTGIVVAQWFGLPVFLLKTGLHGTIGHRTGMGIFLAALIPLGFTTDYGLPLAVIYGLGVALSKSSVASVSAIAGLLVVAPRLWLWVVPFLVAGAIWRSVKRNGRGVKFRHVMDSWHARRHIWRLALSQCRPWPFWLCGHGAQSFGRESAQWIARGGLREHYREAHNDYIEFFFEYGALGVLAAGLWFVSFGPHLALGDPVTGGLVALGVAALANFPFRVAPIASVGLMLVILVMRRAWA